MILVLYKFKLRLHSERSLENGITKDWEWAVKIKTKPMQDFSAVINQMFSLPQVFSAAKLKNESSVNKIRNIIWLAEFGKRKTVWDLESWETNNKE